MSHAKVLVVDDEAHIRQVIALKLRGAGIEVHTEANGAAGLEALKTFHPDLILTDHEMPDLTGLELIRSIRGGVPGCEEFSGTPVLLVTGSVAVAEQIEKDIHEIPNVVVTSKPFSPKLLLKQVMEKLNLAES